MNGTPDLTPTIRGWCSDAGSSEVAGALVPDSLATRHVHGDVREADADEAHPPAGELPRRGGDHHLRLAELGLPPGLARSA
jgi:hypothetical protein